MPPAPATAQRHAYVDGTLPAEEARRVEARLAADPEAAAVVADWRRVNERLHALYDPTLDEAVPARLLMLRPRRWGGVLGRAAAAALLLALGAAGGWWGHDLAPGEVAQSAGRFAERAPGAPSGALPEAVTPA